MPPSSPLLWVNLSSVLAVLALATLVGPEGVRGTLGEQVERSVPLVTDKQSATLTPTLSPTPSTFTFTKCYTDPGCLSNCTSYRSPNCSSTCTSTVEQVGNNCFPLTNSSNFTSNFASSASLTVTDCWANGSISGRMVLGNSECQGSASPLWTQWWYTCSHFWNQISYSIKCNTPTPNAIVEMEGGGAPPGLFGPIPPPLVPAPTPEPTTPAPRTGRCVNEFNCIIAIRHNRATSYNATSCDCTCRTGYSFHEMYQLVRSWSFEMDYGDPMCTPDDATNMSNPQLGPLRTITCYSPTVLNRNGSPALIEEGCMSAIQAIPPRATYWNATSCDCMLHHVTVSPCPNYDRCMSAIVENHAIYFDATSCDCTCSNGWIDSNVSDCSYCPNNVMGYECIAF